MSTITQRRLESLKIKAASYNRAETTWKQVRTWTKPDILKKGDLTKSKENDKWFSYTLYAIPASLVGDSHEIISLDHTGWYADSFQDELIKGCVFAIRNPHKLNGDGGHLFYMPATYYTDFENVTLYNKLYDTAEQAARYADQYAERTAEEERDYHAKDQAEQQIEDLKTEIHQANKDALMLIKEIKAKTYPEPICSAIRHRLYEFLETRTKAYKRIAKLQDNYWLAVENW